MTATPSIPGNAASDTTTQNVRVVAQPFYLPERSRPGEGQYLFGYRMRIENLGETTVQLLDRHWTVIDADGRREEVRGPGVVGRMPRLEPSEHFEYTSACPLRTSWGTMEGWYRFRRSDGSAFKARIGRFYLTPHTTEA